MNERGGESAFSRLDVTPCGGTARGRAGNEGRRVHEVLSIKIFTIFTVSNTNLTRRRRARTRPRQGQHRPCPLHVSLFPGFPIYLLAPIYPPSSPRARGARRHADPNSLDEPLAVSGERTFHRRVDRPLQRSRDLERSDEPMWHLGQNRFLRSPGGM